MLIIQSLLAIVQGVLAVSLIGLILLQQGSGLDAGVAFGSGSSSTMFGARGAGNLLTRLTAILSALFVVNCLALALVYKTQLQQESLLFTQPAEESEAVRDDDVPSLPADNGDNPASVDDKPVMPLEITPAPATTGPDRTDGALTQGAEAPVTDDSADVAPAGEVEADAESMQSDSAR